MDYHTATTLSAHLVCSYYYAGIIKTINKPHMSRFYRYTTKPRVMRELSVLTHRARCDTNHHLPLSQWISHKVASVTMQANKFCIKQHFSWTATERSCADSGCGPDWLQILQVLFHWVFFSSLSLSFLQNSLKHITSLPPYPMNQCKAGKNRACSAFSPFADNAVACVVTTEGRVTYCLLLQAHPCSQEEALPSKAARQSSMVGAAASFETMLKLAALLISHSSSDVC